MSLTPTIGSLPGFGVRLSSDRVVVGSEAGAASPQNVRENVVARRDIYNGPVSVPNVSTVIARVPSGAVYEVRVMNNGATNVFFAIGQPALLTHFPLTPGQPAQFRIAGEQDLTAISATPGGEQVLCWVSELL